MAMNQANHKLLPSKQERHQLFGSVEPGKKTKPVEKDKMPDIQNTVDDFLFQLDSVGIKNVKHPIIINSSLQPQSQTTIGNFQFSTSIKQNSRGTNMSRFTEQLQLYHEQGLSTDFSLLKQFIVELADRLEQNDAEMSIHFPWFYERKGPKSQLKGLNHADVSIYVSYNKDRSGVKTPFYSNLEEKKDYPISVLIDEGSASASEILAVAMKEIGYQVVGKPSFGKGTVQNAMPIGENSTLKLTLYKWLSPEGNWIHDVGVEPTLEVEQPDYYYSNPVQIEEPLQYDETGSQIENVQVMLNGIGYETDRMDGYFDRSTEKAVKEFQEDNDLEATGKVDEETAGMIQTEVVDRIRNNEDDVQLEKALEHLYE